MFIVAVCNCQQLEITQLSITVKMIKVWYIPTIEWINSDYKQLVCMNLKTKCSIKKARYKWIYNRFQVYKYQTQVKLKLYCC